MDNNLAYKVLTFFYYHRRLCVYWRLAACFILLFALPLLSLLPCRFCLKEKKFKFASLNTWKSLCIVPCERVIWLSRWIRSSFVSINPIHTNISLWFPHIFWQNRITTTISIYTQRAMTLHLLAARSYTRLLWHTTVWAWMYFVCWLGIADYISICMYSIFEGKAAIRE